MGSREDIAYISCTEDDHPPPHNDTHPVVAKGTRNAQEANVLSRNNKDQSGTTMAKQCIDKREKWQDNLQTYNKGAWAACIARVCNSG